MTAFGSERVEPDATIPKQRMCLLTVTSRANQLLCVSHAKPGPEKTPETRARRANSSYTSMSASRGLAYTGQQDCGPSDYPMLIHGVTPDVELDSLVPQFPLSKTFLWN